jgi:3-hydroxyisobutyrate dehydrogenase
VSGNPKVVAAGLLTFVVSGTADAWEEAAPFIELLGQGATYVGDGELARLAKICHNLLLGVVAQSLAEITVLAEKGGIARADLLEFINQSVMGSLFTRYKTPAMVKLDFTPTFTPILLRKDFDLGFQQAHDTEVPMPVAAAAREAVQAVIGSGHTDDDFAILLALQAQASGLELEPEDAPVSDGLAPAVEPGQAVEPGRTPARSSG